MSNGLVGTESGVKLAVLSDIHSNIEALDACCAAAQQHGVNAFVCLGDSVNYGPDPAVTLDRIMALPGLIAVLGNHDEAMFRPAPWPESSEIEQAAAWTRRQLRAEHLDFLKDLPYRRHAHGAMFAHAAFDFPDNWDYVVTPKQARGCFRVVNARRLFLGHVHIPYVYSETPGGEIEEISFEVGRTLSLAADRRYLINVGSVGQPRDDINTACFLIYDVTGDAVTFVRVQYDLAETARKIIAAGLHPFYAERLAKGR